MATWAALKGLHHLLCAGGAAEEPAQSPSRPAVISAGDNCFHFSIVSRKKPAPRDQQEENSSPCLPRQQSALNRKIPKTGKGGGGKVFS